MVRVAEDVEGRDVELEADGDCEVRPNPCDRDRTQDVAVGERQHAIGTAGGREVDELTRATVDLSGRLAVGRPVPVQLPARISGVDLPAGEALVATVVSLLE